MQFARLWLNRPVTSSHSDQPAAEPESWTLDHQLHLLAQTESRPGADGWVERRHTDKVRAVCSCGYDSGLVARADLPTNDDLREHHQPRI